MELPRRKRNESRQQLWRLYMAGHGYDDTAIALPVCRWRSTRSDGLATCVSAKILRGRHPRCINRDGSPCFAADHEPLTAAQIEERQRRRGTSQPGPGTELRVIREQLGLAFVGCKCEEHAAQMNRWGVAGCREHRIEIAGWLHAA